MYVCGTVRVFVCRPGLEKCHRLPTYWHLVVLFHQYVFSTADACDVANDSPVTHEGVVVSRGPLR